MDLCKDNLTSEFKCNLCSYVFSKKYNLDRYMKNKHDLEQQKVNSGKNYCHICNKDFSRSTNLQRHIDTIHNVSRICIECNKIFLDLKSLQKHIETEYDQRDNSKECCKLCNYTFSNKSNLHKHMRQFHQIENECKSIASLECPLCNSAFNSMANLHEHIQKQHDVQLEFVTQVFESVDEFKIWKRNTKKEDLAFFTKLRVSGNITYYECHRSGSYQKTGTSKRLYIR